MKLDLNGHPHRRYNILTGEWVLVSPHRTKRPWQGKQEKTASKERPEYDDHCYLCPGNKRANGVTNPIYESVYSFTNDFSALLANTPNEEVINGLLRAKGETGICRVICFSPNHSLTLPLMEVEAIDEVVGLWQKEYEELGANENISHVQIFENKGALMGCSNPHPHGQIWAQQSIPQEVQKKTDRQLKHWNVNGSSLVQDYVRQEIDADERIVFQNEDFVAMVPYWAVWPYEVMLTPKKHLKHIGQLSSIERKSFAQAIKEVTIRFDNLFETSFPYSMGIHQAT